MRGLVGAVVVATTAALGAPVASAGTYDVVSCRAPGANGVNAAWTPFLNALDGSQQPDGFDFIYNCPGAGSQLIARSAARAGQDAFWLHRPTTTSRLPREPRSPSWSSGDGVSSSRPTTA
jgi:hypothetical protein